MGSWSSLLSVGPAFDLSRPHPCTHRVADYVVLNKIDMMNAATVDSLTAIVASLNPLAQVRAAVCRLAVPSWCGRVAVGAAE